MNKSAFDRALYRALARAKISHAVVALGTDRAANPCAYHLPALVAAHTNRDGLTCCWHCATTTSKPRVPSFVLRELTV